MKRFWLREILIVMTSGGAGIVLCVSQDSFWYALLPFAAATIFMLRVALFVRCPKCSRRLKARLQGHTNCYSLWFLYDCPKCKVTWDPGLSGS
jgi:hypothetical protein